MGFLGGLKDDVEAERELSILNWWTCAFAFFCAVILCGAGGAQTLALPITMAGELTNHLDTPIKAPGGFFFPQSCLTEG